MPRSRLSSNDHEAKLIILGDSGSQHVSQVPRNDVSFRPSITIKITYGPYEFPDLWFPLAIRS